MQINSVSNSMAFNGRLLIPHHKEINTLVKFSKKRAKRLLDGNVSKYDLNAYISSLKHLSQTVKKEPKNFDLTVYPIPENGKVKFIYNLGADISDVFEQSAKHLQIVGEEIAIKYGTMLYK